MKSRRLSREIVLQTLFQIDVGKQEPEFALNYLLDNDFLPSDEKTFPSLAAYAREVLAGVLQNLVAIDEIIQRYCKDWTLERLPRVDCNVLRLALYELLYRPDVPVAVTVNEAVELVKAFGGEESSKFVNGVLGKFLHSEEFAKVNNKQENLTAN